jgi:hypothetical protein
MLSQLVGMMSKCIAFDVVNGKAVRCENIVANGYECACSNPMCQRMGSKMVKSDRCVIAAFI